MRDPNDTVTLKVAGEVYTGWESVSVSRSMSDTCARFDIGLFNPADSGVNLGEITDQALFELYLGADLVVTGYIDRVRDGIGTRGSSLSVSGRDKTADLVDCSAVHSPGQWRGQTIEQIAQNLIKPFGLKLRMDAPAGAAFPVFSLEPAESVFDALARMCRMRGLMLRTDPDSTLVFYTPVERRVKGSLELGRNLLDFNADFSSGDRFSHYILKGQSHGAHTAAKDAAAAKATASDPGVKRYRPLIIISDEQATLSGLQTRALWEATTRRAKALQMNVPVQGWRDDGGKLWEPGTTVKLIVAARDLHPDVIIDGVTMTRDKSGTRTALRLALPEAYTTEALLEPKKKKPKKGKSNALYEALSNG